MGGLSQRLALSTRRLTAQSTRLMRSTPFRLTLIYSVAFILGIIALLGAVYWQTADFLIRRVDSITSSESSRLSSSRPEDLPAAIRLSIANDNLRLNRYGLFSRDGQRIEGNGPDLPRDGALNQTPRELLDRDHRSVRVVMRVLPWGEILVVGRDTTQLLELRRVLLNSLLWSGFVIAIIGLAAGVLLSRRQLRRLTQLEAASLAVVRGDLKTRMPLEGSGDELDLFARAINRALDEVEQLLSDIKGVTDTAAHDLRTPLTHVRATLHRVSQEPDLPSAAVKGVEQAVDQLDELLERFRAILRISEIESQNRRAAFEDVDVKELIDQVIDLYAPLAEAAGVALISEIEDEVVIHADRRLVFEALANLVDNAIKFSPVGGIITLSLPSGLGRPELWVQDQGPGIHPQDRQKVLQRFQRGAHRSLPEGSGLGLSIVGAIFRLHQFELVLEDAEPGLLARIVMSPRDGRI